MARRQAFKNLDLAFVLSPNAINLNSADCKALSHCHGDTGFNQVNLPCEGKCGWHRCECGGS